MKLRIPILLTVATVVALPVSAEAAKGPAAKQIRPCAGPNEPAKAPASCGKLGGRGDTKLVDLATSFQIAALSVDGTTAAVDDDPDFDFTMSGGTTIRAQGSDGGRFARLDKGVVGATIKPVTTKITSDARWSDEEAGVYDCSLRWPEASLPRSVTATGIPSPRFSGAIALNWNFVPSGWADCVQGDKRIPLPTVSNAPSDLTTTTYPASAFEGVQPGKLVDLRIDLRRSWTDSGITVTQTWKGTVTLRKLKPKAKR